VHLDIQVEPLGPGEYGVYVSGDRVSDLSVVVTDQFLAELDVPSASVDEVVREAVVYLVEHDAPVGDTIDLDEAAANDEDFVPELQSRLRL
jgi:hypothetical protein